MLRLDHLSVGYRAPRGTVLADLDLTLPAGSFACVLGRNGAGKSTLMRTLAGLQPAITGETLLDEEVVAAMRPQTRAQRVAVVVTERLSSPGLTVDDIAAMGRAPFTDWRGRLTPADRAIVREALERVGADRFSGRLFDDLSDGERQRVMIARAIAQTPRMMVLDEITAFLDLPGRVEIMTLLRDHARSTGTIVLLSSHDLDLSLNLADRIWLLDGAGGLHSGSADELIAAGKIGCAFDTDAVQFSDTLKRFELR